MWYDNNEVNLKAPIVAICKATDKPYYLLTPNVKGYFDWLGIDCGKYNSACGFRSAQEAMDSYSELFYFRNAKIVVDLQEQNNNG